MTASESRPDAAGCDPARCPLCGESNDCQRCTRDTYKGSCWCESHSFPEELLARVPEDARLQACICRTCVTAAWKARPSPRPGPGDSYVDADSGFLVFTAQYLQRRGYCCDNGCRHCPWASGSGAAARPVTRTASGILAGCVSLLFVLAAGPRAGAESVTETFSEDPSARGWVNTGSPGQFRWDATAGTLEVTWDSSKPQGFFGHPLGASLGSRDAFSFGLDLVLSDALGGVRPPRTGAMQVAFGLLDLDRALKEHYPRAAGRAYDLVEFNWFPQGEFPGFGIVDPTVSPAVFSTAGRVAASFTFPLELKTGSTHRIQCSYSPADRRLMVRIVTDGVDVAVRPLELPADFGEFSLNAFAILNWSEADGPYDSLLAHGTVDNITWEIPGPGVGRITLDATGAVSFDSRKGWRYELEASGDLTVWSPVSGESGNDGTLTLSDPREALFQTQFYRVTAHSE